MPHAQTPKDRMFVLVTQDILEMEAIAQVFDAFLFLHYYLCKTWFTSIYKQALYKKVMIIVLKTRVIMTQLY